MPNLHPTAIIAITCTQKHANAIKECRDSNMQAKAFTLNSFFLWRRRSFTLSHRVSEKSKIHDP
jgi:hypothetical protein